jgi:hypothetical protein
MLVRVAAGERCDRGGVLAVVRIGAPHPDDIQVVVEGGHAARRDRTHVLVGGPGAHQLRRPLRAAVRGGPDLHLPAGAHLPGEIHARRVLVVERQPARVVGRASVLGDRATGRRDLVDLPGAAGPTCVVVAVVTRRREAREYDHRAARSGLGRHVMDPGRLCLVEYDVPGIRRDRRPVERSNLLPVCALDLAGVDARVVHVHARVLVRVRVRIRHVNGVATALGVLRVRALARHEDEVSRGRPGARAVRLGGEGRVEVAAAPEQVGLALRGEPDRVRVGVARPARSQGSSAAAPTPSRPPAVRTPGSTSPTPRGASRRPSTCRRAGRGSRDWRGRRG